MALNFSKVQKSFRRMGSTQYSNLFLIPHPLCKKLRHVRIDQCGEHVILDSVLFSIYWVIMSQKSDHQLRYLQTILIKSSWFHVYPLSFKVRNTYRRQRWIWCLLWSCLCNKFPCTLLSNTFNVSLFRHLGYVFVDSVHDPDPRKVLSSNRDSIMISTP